jgi:oxidase EvaA
MVIEMIIGSDVVPARNCLGYDHQKGFPPALAIRARDASSALDSCSLSTALRDDLYVETWIQSVRDYPSLKTMIVPLDFVTGWYRDPQTGNISHETGRFFSVIGLQARHRFNHSEITWDQPMIEQPEIGILGILAKSINGVLHFCLQAKEEPGNIGAAQLSPTVQATYSNYTGVHGGGRPCSWNIF